MTAIAHAHVPVVTPLGPMGPPRPPVLDEEPLPLFGFPEPKVEQPRYTIISGNPYPPFVFIIEN